MLPFYRGAGYVFENLIEKAIKNNFPTLTVLNEYEIQKTFGSYKCQNNNLNNVTNVNGVDLFCSDGSKFLTIQVKLVTSHPKTKSVRDFINTSLMIESKISKPVFKMFVTTHMPFIPGIKLCNEYGVQIIYHNNSDILIDNLISILKFGHPVFPINVDADEDIEM